MKRLFLLVMIGLLLFPSHSFANEETVPSGMLVSDVKENVDQIMEKYIGEDIPGASVAIVKDGRILLLEGYGQSDIDKNIPVNPEKTVFEAGSISKLYTWSAVMQLVEQGKLDLHADIRQYLPKNYLNLSFDEKITLLDLMNHTAGFEDKAEKLLTTKPEEIIPLDKFLTNENQPKQVFRPGTVIAYSNYGTSLAGYIIEHVSGQPYTEYMQEHVLSKLHMKNSSFEQRYDSIKNISNHKGHGYEKKGNHFEQKERVYINDAPAGSLNTTAKDMAYFMLAHLDENQTDYQLFNKKETLSMMHEQTYSINPHVPGNAHGFWEGFNGGNRVIGHGGNVVGYTSYLALVPEENFGICILMNVANEASGIRTDLISALIGENEKPKAVSVSKNDKIVEGTYRIARGVYSNFLSFLPVISNDDYIITENEKGGINLKTSYEKEPIHYVETSPLVYERVDDHLTLMDKSGLDMSRMAFEVNGGKVVKMSFGVISDFLPVKALERASTNMILFLACFIVFVLYSFFFLFNFIRRLIKSRKEQVNILSKGYKSTVVLAIIGMVTCLNIILLFVRFITDPFQSLLSLQIHLFINWLLPVMTIICLYFVIRSLKQTGALGKIFQLALTIVSILFSFLLISFHLLF